MCDFSTEYMYAMSAFTYYCSNLRAAGDDSVEWRWRLELCSSGVSLGDYCCAEGVGQAKVAQVGSVTQARALAQRSLRRADLRTTIDDRFAAKRRLGSEGNKRCCDFYERDFNSDDGLYKGCNACGDEIAQDYLGRSNPASVRHGDRGTLTSTDKQHPIHLVPAWQR